MLLTTFQFGILFSHISDKYRKQFVDKWFFCSEVVITVSDSPPEYSSYYIPCLIV
jgi:hypothetical protein